MENEGIARASRSSYLVMLLELHAQPNMPFGGLKDSGYGREHEGFGVKEFVNAKAIMLLD